MRSARLTAAAAAGTLVALAAPALSRGAAPPSRPDPCARAGRDACGTTGVGFYKTYRYGIRWFGDFRGAVPGQAHTFCLDLGLWYASRSYRYRPLAAKAVLRNKDGEPVPLERRRRLAYAIWSFGRTTKPARQAAVMLYVHSLIGDARPGEVDPAALGPKVASLVRRVARASASYHGPYRIQARLPATLTVGKAAAATVRVLSASGRPLPHLRLTLSARGARGTPAHVRTDGAGRARLRLTPTAAAGLRLRVRTDPLASTLPHVFVPTAGAARTNGQRLAVPASQRVSSTVLRTDVRVAPTLTSQVSTPQTTPGAAVTSTVAVTGLGGAKTHVQVELFGPYPRADQVSCSGSPYWSSSFTANGDTTMTTAPVQLERAGYYGFRASIPAQSRVVGSTTPCAGSTTVAIAHPGLSTAVATAIARRGSRISDVLHVSGLGKTEARVEVELYGPFGSRKAIRCTARRLLRKELITVHGNGTTRTPPVRLAHAGFYGYRERLLATPLVTGVATACAPGVETSLVAPEIVTGRGDVASYVASPDASGRRPTRVRIGSLGIDAPVLPAGIDLAHDALGIPSDIHRAGWWRDGALPGTPAGAVLVAGHRDSAHAGVGAFFALPRARPGDRIELATASGRTFAYRVVTVRSYRKRRLPGGIFSTRGRPRLVLVTCGGPFDAATGHYRDDIVVTALPAA